MSSCNVLCCNKASGSPKDFPRFPSEYDKVEEFGMSKTLSLFALATSVSKCYSLGRKMTFRA